MKTSGHHAPTAPTAVAANAWVTPPLPSTQPLAPCAPVTAFARGFMPLADADKGAFIRHPSRHSRALDDAAARQPLQRLITSDTDVSQLLARQPSYDGVLREAFKAALEQRFPGLPQPVDPEAIYVTQYREQEQLHSGGHVSWQRVATATRTLTQVLNDYLETGLEPTFDQQRVGFYQHPEGLADGDKIAGLFAPAFEDVVREVGRASLYDYPRALSTFWNTEQRSLGLSMTPREWLVASLGAQRRSEALLRRTDETLTAAGQALLERSLAASANEDACTAPGQFSLALAGPPGSTYNVLSGALVIADSPAWSPGAASGPVLLLIPGQGLLEFSSGIAMEEGLHQLFADGQQRPWLLGPVSAEEEQHALSRFNTTSALRYSLIEGSAFAYCVDALLARQQETLRQAAQKGGVIDRGADLGLRVGTVGLLAARARYKLDKSLEDFLAPATPTQRAQWTAALASYETALSEVRAAQLPAVHDFLDPSHYDREIRAFAREKVQLWIKDDLQFNLNPDQILVHTRRLNINRSPLPPSDDGRVRLSNQQMTLTELALANSAPLDSAYLGEVSLTNLEGVMLSPLLVRKLTPDYLKTLVRSINLGKRYTDVLQNELLDGPEARRRQSVYVPLMRAQLGLEASEAAILGAGEGLSAAGFEWMEKALKRNATAPGVSAASQLQIGGNTLRNILIFSGPQAPDGTARLVLYAADAPGGKNLHEFANSRELATSFINNPALRDYLLGHTAQDNVGEMKRMLDSGVRGTDVSIAPIKGEFLGELYRAQARHVIANADAASTSNRELSLDAARERINVALDLGSMFLPFAVTLPLALGRTGASFFGANEALRRGEDNAALGLMAEGIGQLADGIGLGGTPGLRPHLSAPQRLGVKQLKRLQVSERRVEGLIPNASGIYRTPEGQFLVGVGPGQWVRVKSDFKAGDQQLQVINPNSGRETGLHLTRTGNGQWIPTEQLRGGVLSGEQVLMENALLPDEHSAMVFLDTFNFPADRRARLRLDLASDLVNAQGAIPHWAQPYRTFPGAVVAVMPAATPLPPAPLTPMEISPSLVPVTPAAVSPVASIANPGSPAQPIAGPSHGVSPSPSQSLVPPAFPRSPLDVPSGASHSGPKPNDMRGVNDLMPVPGSPHVFSSVTYGETYVLIGDQYYWIAPDLGTSTSGAPEVFVYNGKKDALGFLNEQSNAGMPYRAVFDGAANRWVLDPAPVYKESAVKLMARLFPDLANPDHFAAILLEKALSLPCQLWSSAAQIKRLVSVLEDLEQSVAAGTNDLLRTLTPRTVTLGGNLSGFGAGLNLKIGVADLAALAAAPSQKVKLTYATDIAKGTLTRLGYEILPGAQYDYGASGVSVTFKKPGFAEVYIMAVRYLKQGSIALNRAIPGNPPQMSNAWVDSALAKSAGRTGVRGTANQAIREAQTQGKLIRLVAGFEGQGFSIVRIGSQYR